MYRVYPLVDGVGVLECMCTVYSSGWAYRIYSLVGGVLECRPDESLL